MPTYPLPSAVTRICPLRVSERISGRNLCNKRQCKAAYPRSPCPARRAAPQGACGEPTRAHPRSTMRPLATGWRPSGTKARLRPAVGAPGRQPSDDGLPSERGGPDAACVHTRRRYLRGGPPGAESNKGGIPRLSWPKAATAMRPIPKEWHQPRSQGAAPRPSHLPPRQRERRWAAADEAGRAEGTLAAKAHSRPVLRRHRPHWSWNRSFTGTRRRRPQRREAGSPAEATATPAAGGGGRATSAASTTAPVVGNLLWFEAPLATQYPEDAP